MIFYCFIYFSVLSMHLHSVGQTWWVSELSVAFAKNFLVLVTPFKIMGNTPFIKSKFLRLDFNRFYFNLWKLLSFRSTETPEFQCNFRVVTFLMLKI